MGIGHGENRRTINTILIPLFALVMFGADLAVYGLPTGEEKHELNAVPSTKKEHPEGSQNVAQNEIEAGNKAGTSVNSVEKKSNDRVPTNDAKIEESMKTTNPESVNANNIDSKSVAPTSLTETGSSKVSSKLLTISNDSSSISASKISEVAPDSVKFSASSVQNPSAEDQMRDSRAGDQTDESKNQKRKIDADMKPSANIGGSDSFNNLAESYKTSNQKDKDPSSVNGNKTSSLSSVVVETIKNISLSNTVSKEQENAGKTSGNLNLRTNGKKEVDKTVDGQSEVDLSVGKAVSTKEKNKMQIQDPRGSSGDPSFPPANSNGWSLGQSKNTRQFKNTRGFVFKAMGEPSFQPQVNIDQSTQAGLHGIALEYLLMLLCVIVIAILLVWRKFWYAVCTTWFPRSHNQNVPINAYKVGYRPLNRN
ncbi:hypothetical protein FGIG_04448 [Fasciola gigantica]|uniref:Uncharacterized protein n=1 Tax=Fasciola gigantica TaxID=46835 RepID=A0A504Z7H5_FASGI|nr:hypothetical protein FGIG_04448 [Fasciola gigantica]